MADNVLLPATGTGTASITQATDDVSSVHYPVVKLADGTADATTRIAAGNGVHGGALRVTLASDGTGVVGLAAGTANIGDVDVLTIAAGDNNIGNVDIVTMPGVAGTVAHDGSTASNPITAGGRAVAHGANPTAVAAADVTDSYHNRAGVQFVIGGHPNPQMYGLSITTAISNTIIGPTVGAGLKLVVTSLTVTLDNASTVFPSIVIGFGTASTPAFATTPGTAKVIAGHPGVPAGGGFSRGDGTGIIGVGADDEELRITTVGTASSMYVVMTGFTVES